MNHTEEISVAIIFAIVVGVVWFLRPILQILAKIGGLQ